MNQENGQPKVFKLAFCSGGTLLQKQYKDQELEDMFFGPTAEFVVDRNMRPIFRNFISHAVMGDFMLIKLRGGTYLDITRINPKKEEKTGQ